MEFIRGYEHFDGNKDGACIWFDTCIDYRGYVVEVYKRDKHVMVARCLDMIEAYECARDEAERRLRKEESEGLRAVVGDCTRFLDSWRSGRYTVPDTDELRGEFWKDKHEDDDDLEDLDDDDLDEDFWDDLYDDIEEE